MNSIPSREFQLNYQRLDEPVTVMARSRTLGTWYPKGTEPFEDVILPSAAEKLKEYEAEIKYLKSELAARSVVTKTSQFYPTEANTPDNVHAPAVAVRAAVKPGGFGHSKPAPKGK